MEILWNCWFARSYENLCCAQWGSNLWTFGMPMVRWRPPGPKLLKTRNLVSQAALSALGHTHCAHSHISVIKCVARIAGCSPTHHYCALSRKKTPKMPISMWKITIKIARLEPPKITRQTAISIDFPADFHHLNQLPSPRIPWSWTAVHHLSAECSQFLKVFSPWKPTKMW